MRAEDVTDTLDLALQASGCDQVHVVHKPRLLSDNGSSYVSDDLAEWLKDKGMKHSRGAPYHPQTQGKIERWHQTLKNVRRGNAPRAFPDPPYPAGKLLLAGRS
jgi:transposase InsO family protein